MGVLGSISNFFKNVSKKGPVNLGLGSVIKSNEAIKKVSNNPTNMLHDFIAPVGGDFVDQYLFQGKSAASALRHGLTSRVQDNEGLAKAIGLKRKVAKAEKNNEVPADAFNREKKLVAGDKYETNEYEPLTKGQMFKSMFYNNEGVLQKSRIVGFGGGAIAGSYLALSD